MEEEHTHTLTGKHKTFGPKTNLNRGSETEPRANTEDSAAAEKLIGDYGMLYVWWNAMSQNKLEIEAFILKNFIFQITFHCVNFYE